MEGLNSAGPTAILSLFYSLIFSDSRLAGTVPYITLKNRQISEKERFFFFSFEKLINPLKKLNPRSTTTVFEGGRTDFPFLLLAAVIAA